VLGDLIRLQACRGRVTPETGNSAQLLLSWEGEDEKYKGQISSGERCLATGR